MNRILLLLFFTITTIFAQTMPTDHRLTSGVLPNGMNYIVMHNEKPKDMVEFRLYVGAGALEEEKDQRGLAHFVEHMAFNGTKHFKKNELVDYLESIGLRFGGDLNADTNFVHTLYKLSVPVEKSNLDTAFLILHDWANGLNFDSKEFEKERGVVLEEKRVRNSATYRLMLQYLPLFYKQSEYAGRTVIGDEDVLKHADVQRAIDFYKKWYRPELMTLVIAGDIDTKTLEQKIKNEFSDLNNGNSAKPLERAIADINETRVILLTDKEIVNDNADLYFIQRVSAPKTREDRKRQIIDKLLQLMFNHNSNKFIFKPESKLLNLAMREEYITPFNRVDIFHAEYQSKNRDDAFVELNRIVYAYAKFGFNEKVFNIAKSKLLTSNENRYKERGNELSVNLISKVLKSVEDGSIFVDQDYDYNATKEILSEISLKDLNRRYREIAQNRNRVIVFMTTDGGKISKEKSLKLIEDAQKSIKKDDTNATSLTKLPPMRQQCGKIIKKEFNKKSGIYRYTLENNLTVEFKPTDLKKNEVLLSAVSSGGYSSAKTEDLDSLHKAAQWVVTSAPGKIKNEDMGTILSDKKLYYSFDITPFWEVIRGSSSRKDFETLLHLIYLQVKEPKIDPNVARQLKNKFLSFIEKSDRNPAYRFEKELKKFYYNNNPRIIFFSKERVQKLNSQKMLSLFKRHFSDMNNFKFIVVGDIEKEEFERLISCYLANLPTGEKLSDKKPEVYKYRKGNQKFIRAYNNSNIANISLEYRTSIPYSVHNAAVINTIQDILTKRFRKTIREEKSGTYGVSVQCKLVRELENKVTCEIEFASDPERRVGLIKSLKEQIDLFVKNGAASEELIESKREFKIQFKQIIKENAYWLEVMKLNTKYNTPLDDYLNIVNELDSVTLDDIEKVAKKIFMGDSLLGVRVPKSNKE